MRQGVITGYYVDQNGARHGFVRPASGTPITTIDAPGASTAKGLGTVAISINTAGVIAGQYADASKMASGFVRAANGTITTFDVPSASKDCLAGGAGDNHAGGERPHL